MLSYIVTGNSITILIDNRPEIIDSTHQNFEKVELALKNGATEKEILNLMNVAKAVIDFGEGHVKVKDGEITYRDRVVHSALSRRILSLMEQGFDISPFTKFMENLYQNPSKSAVDETYGFLEACNLPITEDGCFLAYKKITDDYLDCYSGKIDNSIGATPSMPRYEVNEDSNQACSSGLHVASYSYMTHYSGARIVICKVNPKNVVAVPNDYNNAKMRVCEYKVINEVKVKDEQISDDVISDDEAYSENYPTPETPTGMDAELQGTTVDCDTCTQDVEDDTVSEVVQTNDEHGPAYTGCQEMLDDVDAFDFEEMKDLYRNVKPAMAFLGLVTSSTSFWKRDLIVILHNYYGFGDCPGDDNEDNAKVKFSDKLRKFLDTYEYANWNKLAAFIVTKDASSAGLVQTSYELKDSSAIINKIKSLVKNGDFKKKEIIAALDI